MKQSIIVLYRSKTGFTKWYAEQIAAELDCAAVALSAVRREQLSACDTLIFGGRAHAGRLSGLSRARKLAERSGIKRLVIFATGATPNRAEDTVSAFWRNNLSAQELERIPHFYMQSGLRYEAMGPVDKLMMKGLSSMLRKKKDPSPEDLEMARMIETSSDYSSPECIVPLVNMLKEEIQI